ncbi:MAG: hypothetical protein ACK5Y2_13255 [Bdellovibrionales bacterium]
MAEKVKLSKDGSSIDFVQSESLPTSVKKFRQSPEIEGFYRFIFENDLQKEAYEILNKIIEERKLKKAQAKKEAKEAARLEKTLAAEQAKKLKAAAKAEAKAAKNSKLTVKAAPAKGAAKAPVAKAANKASAKAAPKAAKAQKPAKAAAKKAAPAKKAAKKK